MPPPFVSYAQGGGGGGGGKSTIMSNKADHNADPKI